MLSLAIQRVLKLTISSWYEDGMVGQSSLTQNVIEGNEEHLVIFIIIFGHFLCTPIVLNLYTAHIQQSHKE